MERAEVLLEKLGIQLKGKAGKDQLLQTLRLLYEEIMALPGADRTPSASAKVSVILPQQTPFSFPPAEPMSTEEKIVETLQVDESEIEAELRSIRESAELKNELSLKARVMPAGDDAPSEEIPTLASHLPYMPASVKPESDQIQESAVPPAVDATAPETSKSAAPLPGQEPSLNDKLRAAQKELADELQAAPVKDLRKAIGINDRYLYINELFQGNEAMFERSLKTLNAFTILPEAEFWMQRELRMKLGWKDGDPLVQQFIQLVKRRFS
jgi:hypothetical protein